MGDNMAKTLGLKSCVQKNELIRIIVQCLYSLGYERSASFLESESCISCKSPEFVLLETHILNADWDGCIDCLGKINGLTDEVRDMASFLVLQQWMLESLKVDNIKLALDTLRKKVGGLKISGEYVHKLSSDLVSVESGLGGDDTDVHELRRSLVLQLEKVLPPPITLPQRRLEFLVEMAVSAQIDRCMYHSSSDMISLYRDHCCSRDKFPTETIQILREHEDEVWFVQFSNNGDYLASSSSDRKAIIWEVGDDKRVTLKHRLGSHENAVSFVAWSPDDTMLLTCGNMEVLKLWDVETGTCKRTFRSEGFTVSSCAWFPDSKHLVCGSSDPKKGICVWDCDGNEVESWKGMRMPKVVDLAVTPDGKNLISIFSEKEIRILNLSKSPGHFIDVSKSSEIVISEEHAITSLSVSGDSKFLIVNLNSREIHMWDIAGKWSKPLRYEGHMQQKYVIRSCFGGLNSMFIATGSEDSKVYIWNRRSSTPLEILSGHQKTVNCVSWNPKRPQLLASASDDGTIRIWGPKRSFSEIEVEQLFEVGEILS